MNLEILYLFLIPALTGVLIFLVGKRSRLFAERSAVIGSALTFVVSCKILIQTTQGEILSLFREEFRVDALGGLIAGMVAFLGVIAVVYSLPYIRKETERGVIPRERFHSYYGWIMLFLASMLWASTTNNIILLWVIIEATTLASVILVAFYWNRDALEAGYKYAMLLTVGITFALFGCVLLYAGSSPHIPSGLDPLKITEIAKVAGKIPKSIALLSVVLLLAGFGTKAGIVPFHTWLPDAHAEAPTPVSALLSGVMIKVGVYAIIRTVLILYPFYPVISPLVLILGVITMIVGVLMMFFQEDMKRLLAFCSVVSIGFIIMGLGLGNYLGIYGALFHLVNHSLMKALAFFSFGGVIYATGSRRISELGGLGKVMPLTGLTFFVAALALGGIPLFNGFMSEFTLFLAGVKAGHAWATVIAVLVAILTLAAFIHASYNVFMGALPQNLSKKKITEVPPAMWGGMVILSLLCVVIGVFPQILYPLLYEATKAIFSMVAMP
ncbi:MAG: oxidoreductase [Deltaproteobacteria bacterium]|nr:oxidoreductase [Deltaproteobacteria bacterium]